MYTEYIVYGIVAISLLVSSAQDALGLSFAIFQALGLDLCGSTNVCENDLNRELFHRHISLLPSAKLSGSAPPFVTVNDIPHLPCGL